MRIDLDFIKKWIPISTEELMERLVKDAAELQKEAINMERNAEIEKRMQDETYNIAWIREFLTDYSYLHTYFTDSEILLACKHHVAKTDLVKTITLRGHREPSSLGIRFVRHVSRAEFTEISGNGWTRTILDHGTVMYYPSQYQSSFSGKIVKELLLQRLPYLNQFTVEVYGNIDPKHDFIFIQNPKKTDQGCDRSLYISMGDLLSGKTGQELLKHHKEYWHTYNAQKYDEPTSIFLASAFVQHVLETIQKFTNERENK